MKKIVLILIGVTLMGCSSNKIVINGNLARLGDRELSIYVRDSLSKKRVIATTKASNDKFRFEIEKIKMPTYAYLAMIGSEVRFILEPGVINITSGMRYGPVVSGTKYNDGLYGWRSWPAALKIDSMVALLEDVIKAPDYENSPQELKEEVKSKFRRFRYERDSLERIALNDMFSNSDEYGQLFSILHNSRLSGRQIEELLRIEKTIGSNSEIDFFKYLVNEEKVAQMQREKLNIGNPFIDFSGTKADGSEVKLSEVVAKNKLTMVEFWASWCAPCRAEIPHMKEVYKNYQNKGFEIFSFSVDAKKEDWLKADMAEDLTWISTSGDVENVSNLYVVKSVPASVLIDGNGKIVAKNLRGKQLDKFVNKFLE